MTGLSRQEIENLRAAAGPILKQINDAIADSKKVPHFRVEAANGVDAEKLANQVSAAMNRATNRKRGGIVTGDLFDKLGKEIHETNVEKGFWEEPEMMDKYVAKLALIHSEVTEVLEALRKQQGKDKVTEEFADILIRTFDLYNTLVEAGEADRNLYNVTRKKMEANKQRPPKHNHRWG